MSLSSTIKNWVRRPGAYVGAEWRRLAPRERRLVIGGVAGVLGVAAGLLGFLMLDTLATIAEENDDAREALAAMSKHRDEYLEAKAKMVAQEVRIGSEPAALAADLEAAAKAVGIGIPETSEQPEKPAGQRYVERSVDVKLRGVDLLALSNFLAKLENGRRLIVVTRLDVRRRFAEGEKLDVELTATAFERTKDDHARKRPVPAGLRDKKS